MTHDAEPSPDSSKTGLLSEDARERFLQEVIRGLSQTSKILSSKYFYDERGSRLFDAICELDVYYLTRTELMIMTDHASEIAESLGSRCAIIEYGSGSSTKTRILLEEADVAIYVPVDISADHLEKSAANLRAEYPEIPVRPVTADFTQAFALPPWDAAAEHRVIYFPGSTIGNFAPFAARKLLEHMAEIAGNGGRMLIGIDLKKDPSILTAAYNDADGITADFNLNILLRINQELGADFDLKQFEHRAVYNQWEGRIEMHLVSLTTQKVQLANHTFEFAPGESICTEFSHKYDLDQFRQLAQTAGWQIQQTWMDDQQLFAIVYAECVPRTSG